MIKYRTRRFGIDIEIVEFNNESAFHHVGIAPGKPAVISIVEF